MAGEEHQTQITLQVKDLVTGDTREYVYWRCEKVTLDAVTKWEEHAIGTLGVYPRLLHLDVALSLRALHDEDHDGEVAVYRHIEKEST